MGYSELIKHPRFQEFLSNMLMTIDQFHSLDEEMQLILLRNFENWLKRVGESPPATAIIRCPYCGRTIEVRLTARKTD